MCRTAGDRIAGSSDGGAGPRAHRIGSVPSRSSIMARRGRPGSAVLAITILIGVGPLPEAPTPASGQEPSAEAKAALQERDRLWDQSQKLRDAGKTTEAIAAAEAMLAIERKVLSADHEDTAVTLSWLADLHLV